MSQKIRYHFSHGNGEYQVYYNSIFDIADYIYKLKKIQVSIYLAQFCTRYSLRFHCFSTGLSTEIVYKFHIFDDSEFFLCRV